MPTPAISFEFFPPRTPEGREKLIATREQLAAVHPAGFSVTYGAAGSTRDNTRDIVMDIHNAGYKVAPHLSFGNDDAATVIELVRSYKAAGITQLVALRGDAPPGVNEHRLVHANELVALIHRHFGDHFHIKVAAYPEIHPDAESYEQDVYWLGEKFRAGANAAITQYFYNPDAYFYFMDECARQGIDRPVYPGIMPITNYQSLVRFSNLCGADIPRWLGQRLQAFGDDSDAVREFGIDVVTKLCDTLIAGGAPGFHFYTLNHAEPTLSILANLGITSDVGRRTSDAVLAT